MKDNIPPTPLLDPIRFFALGLAFGDPSFARDLSDRCGVWSWGNDSLAENIFLSLEALLADLPKGEVEIGHSLGLPMSPVDTLKDVLLNFLDQERLDRFNAEKVGTLADRLALEMRDTISRLVRITKVNSIPQG